MIITCKGGTAKQKKLVKSIADWSARYLMTDRLVNTLTVEVKMIKDLFLKEGCYGDLDYYDWGLRRPKDFILRVDSSMTLRSLLTTVAHEMVHAKQFARDEMRATLKNGESVTYWKGEYYGLDENYWESPWEIEAHGLEKSLYELWSEEEGVYEFEDCFPKGYWESKGEKYAKLVQ
jgi:hypothetical protein